MRRFFTRFAVAGGGTGKDASETDASTQEKVGLASSTKPNSGGGGGGGGGGVAGDRVRELTARYETLTASSTRADGGGPGTTNEATLNHGKQRSGQAWFSSPQRRQQPHDEDGDVGAPQGQMQSRRWSEAKRDRTPIFRLEKQAPSRARHAEQDQELAQQASRTSSTAPTLPAPLVLPIMNDAEARFDFTQPDEHLSSLSSQDAPADAASSLHAVRGGRVVNESIGDGANTPRGSGGGGGGGTSGATGQSQSKSVAFAPSPKKPTRPSSPDEGLSLTAMQPPPMPERALEEVARFSSAGFSSSSLSNFAKPTLASSARARLGGKQNSLTSGNTGASTVAPAQHTSHPSSASMMSTVRGQATEKFPSTSTSLYGRTSLGTPSVPQAGPAPKMRRSNSAGTRRGTSSGAASPFSTSAHLDSGISSSVQRIHSAGGLGASSSTNAATFGARESSGHPFPSSIPLVGGPGYGAFRSASPQSIATGSSVLSGPGAVPDFFSNPRRASFQGRYHSGGSSHGAGGSTGLAASSSVRSIGAPSWSEMTQDDLVSNLGARERTRQEVLWEIVASEERYVQELEKTKEFFLDALLHPNRLNPPTSAAAAHAATLSTLEGRGSQTRDTVPSKGRKDAMQQQSGLHADVSDRRKSSSYNNNNNNNADLPIAARFMSAASVVQQQHLPSTDVVAVLSQASSQQPKVHSPYTHGSGLASTPQSSRPQSMSGGEASTTVQMSTPALSTSGVVKEKKNAEGAKDGKRAVNRWSQRRSNGSHHVASSQEGYDLTNGSTLIATLPASLRAVLEAIDNGVHEGHALLSEALRVRYDEQWPLVRSLADVFSRFSYVLKYYRSYVLNLERALDCLEEAALMERAMRGKRLRKDRLSSTVALGRAVASLEAVAAERGECGLAIFLAMPFQRLLKYPLLFQNLLFHTDASTFEFENTVKMVVDVERIVRSIEDDKVNKDERDKTIDAFARIEGIKDRALLRPKSDRILIEERATYQENPRRAISESNDAKGASMGSTGGGLHAGAMTSDGVASTAMSTPLGVGSGNLRASIRSKRSYRRLSDLLTLGQQSGATGEEGAQAVAYTKAPNMGSKRDVWLLRFSDVELRCQRIGVTALPMISTAALSPSDALLKSTVGQEHYDDETQTEEERMRDEFKRTRESKERLRALRNTTLRSKTRNLYKFLGVSSWKVTRDRPNVEDVDGLEGLATAHEEDEELGEENDDDLDAEDDEDDDESDGGESGTSQETDGGLLDSEHYIRQSKLSFSYGGQDRVEPIVSQAGSVTSSRSSHAHDWSATHNRYRATVGQKRHSMGSSSHPSGAGSESGAVVHPVAISSRSVMAASRMRSDKFGSRLRNAAADGYVQRRGSMPSVVDTSHVDDDDDDDDDDEKHEGETNGNEEEIEQASDQVTYGKVGQTQKRDTGVSFVRDRSMDSNMYMMGTLVQHGTAQ